MSNKEEFDKLKLDEKAFLVFESGFELASDVNQSMMVKLYALIDFFVEVSYLPMTNKIDTIKAITLNDLIEKYSDSIDISDIFK